MNNLLTYINIVAVALSPVIAVIVTLLYQQRKEKRQVKFDLFLTLMANRKKYPPSQQWVDSLNKIDVVFQNNKKVRGCWRAYYDSLHPKSQHSDMANSFLLDLLSEIALDLGYKNLKQTEIDKFYSPQFFGNQVANQEIVFQEFLRVLLRSKSFSEAFSEEEVQSKLQELSKRLDTKQ
jgi:hypothetical protein